MPELVYRTYDPIFKRMVEPGDLALSLEALEKISKEDTHDSLTGVEEPHIHIFAVLNMMAKVNGYIYMQYTGLKDKKMKPVFDGDIGIYYFGLQKRTGYIRYYAGRWIVDSNPPKSKKLYTGADLADIFDGILWDEDEHPFEVIGNIYENPELLNG